MHVKPKRVPWTSTRTLAWTSWSQGAANKIGRLADSINTKSARQAYRVGDNERCGLLCCVARSLVPGMYRQRLQLIRTPWHHLVGYQSLVFGMYRQRRSSNALLGTISSAIKAWVLACIASACSSYALLGTTSSAITAWFRACIAGACSSAAHTHSLVPPHQLSPRLPSFELR